MIGKIQFLDFYFYFSIVIFNLTIYYVKLILLDIF